MSIVLNTEQREQAGADSYNRFEYQAHWIVYHIIAQLNKQPKCIVFCEFHDDMAQLAQGENSPFEFYQIKTKEEDDDWTVAKLSEREKRKNGTYKKSFLGFIFYNFLKFGDECSSCHFVSNNGYDKDIKNWQAFIEDNKILKDENVDLYNRIKERIKAEYNDDHPDDFDAVFERFIQKTFVYSSELQLSTYETQVSGIFFKQLADKKIPTDTANLIFQQLVNDVRRKSKEKISHPISMRSLIEKKGIRVNAINEALNHKIGASGNYDDFTGFLNVLFKDRDQVKRIINAKTLHDSRLLDVEDIKYQEIVLVLRKTISMDSLTIADLNNTAIKCVQNLKDTGLYSETFDESLIEVLYYDKQFRQQNKK